MSLVYLIYTEEDWIVNKLGKEWKHFNPKLVTENIEEADIIWLLTHSMIHQVPKNFTGKLIVTIHHLVPWKLNNWELKKLKFIENISHVIHTISTQSLKILKKIFHKPILYLPFWINQEDWFPIDNKNVLRSQYNFNSKDFLVGSFQNDTEYLSIASGDFNPKLEKGPDIFLTCVKNLMKKHPNLKVILTADRRHYLEKNLENNKIPYISFGKVNTQTLNELYNCLDLYIVGSRIEGSPRSIYECAITKTPLYSTTVGISDLICESKSLFNMHKPESILNCRYNTEYNYLKVLRFKISNYMKEFTDILLDKSIS